MFIHEPVYIDFLACTYMLITGPQILGLYLVTVAVPRPGVTNRRTQPSSLDFLNWTQLDLLTMHPPLKVWTC